MKNKKITYNLLLYLLFIVVNSNVLAAEVKNHNINFFEEKLELLTNISFSEKNKILWLSDFKVISQNDKQTIYKLENQKIEILRYITKYQDKINIEDHYTNKSDQILGFISNYEFLNFFPTLTKISGIKNSDKILAENPTILSNDNKISIGIYLNDDFSKINSKIKINKSGQLNIYNDNLIIKPNKKYIKSFSLYKFNRLISYYDFINFLRKELKVHSYIDGNLLWFDTYKHRKILNDKSKLKNLFKNYGVKYLIITPWLDYDNYNHSKNEKWNREKFRERLTAIKKIIKSVDPKISLLLALQSNVININSKIQKIVRTNKSNKVEMGFNHYDLDINNLIDLGINKKEIIIDNNNRILFETYYHDWKYGNTQNLEEIALALKAYHNGYLFNKLIEQINFTIDEIGYDGIYIDQFNQHFISPKHTMSFDKQNVNIAKINGSSGQIEELRENISLNTLKFKKKIIDYVLSKTKHVFFNTHHINDELRTTPVIRFAEGFWYFWVEKMWKKNSRDFFPAQTFFTSHLSTPVSLSLGTIQKGDWQLKPHNALVKNLRFCLYNGNLMYFLDQDFERLEIKETKLNVFNKLYPIKVEKIYQGKIIGEKKIISIVDVKVSKKKFKDYNFLYFDKEGFFIEGKVKKITEREDDVIVHLEKDEILIMEKK